MMGCFPLASAPLPQRRGCPTSALFSWHRVSASVLKTEKQNPTRPVLHPREDCGAVTGRVSQPAGLRTHRLPPAQAAPRQPRVQLRSAWRVRAPSGPVLETLLRAAVTGLSWEEPTPRT